MTPISTSGKFFQPFNITIDQGLFFGVGPAFELFFAGYGGQERGVARFAIHHAARPAGECVGRGIFPVVMLCQPYERVIGHPHIKRTIRTQQNVNVQPAPLFSPSFHENLVLGKANLPIKESRAPGHDTTKTVLYRKP